MKHIIILTTGLLILLAYTQPTFAKRPPVREGEFIKLRATVAGVEGGFSELIVRKVQKWKRTLKLRATMLAKTNTFFDKIHKINNLFESKFSLRLGTRFRYHLNADEGGHKQHRTLTFHKGKRYGRLTLRVQRFNKKGQRQRAWYRKRRVPKNTRDLISALYYARFLPYRRGKKFSFHVFVMGKIWQVRGSLIRKTKLYTAIGPKRALVIKAKFWRMRRPGKGQVVRLWLSDDKLRIPLKMRGRVPGLGIAEAKIMAYRRSFRSRLLSKDTRRRKKRSNVWRFISEF